MPRGEQYDEDWKVDMQNLCYSRVVVHSCLVFFSNNNIQLSIVRTPECLNLQVPVKPVNPPQTCTCMLESLGGKGGAQWHTQREENWVAI